MGKVKVTPLARIVEFGQSADAKDIDEAIGLLRMLKSKRFGAGSVNKRAKKPTGDLNYQSHAARLQEIGSLHTGLEK